MLYTFSRADYNVAEFARYIAHTYCDDAVLLWQDGVYLALKETDILRRSRAKVYVLEADAQARGITGLLPVEWLISLADVVALTESVTPQFAL